MNNKWLKLFLSASLALNLAFVSFLLYKYFQPQHSRRTGSLGIGARLDLTAPQREKIDEIVADFRYRLAGFKQDILAKRMDIVDELGNPDSQVEDIKTRVDELNRIEGQLNRAYVDALVQVSNTLDAGRRLEFLYRLSKNWFFINKKRGKHEKR